MFKKIFAKYFMITSLIILISFYVLGITLFFFFSQYVINEKRNTMLENGKVVSQLVTEFVANSSLLRDVAFQTTIQSISTALDVHIVVGTNDGSVWYCTDTGNCDYHNGKLPEAYITLVQENGAISLVGTLDGFFASQNLTVGVPFDLPSGSMGGVVVLASSSQISPALFGDIVRLFFLSSLMVMVVAFVVLFFVTRKLVTPLWAMNGAAKKMAKGNFDVEIHVKGDDEVAELAIAFNNMAASLRTLEDMRRSFMWNVSHELKTPMTVISGFVEGILDGTIPPEKEQQYLKTVHTEILRLSRLVGDLLEVARIEAGTKKQEKVNFDISEMLARIMLSYEQKVSEKHIQVSIDTPDETVTVYGDMDDLYRVAYNLIDNAVKFANDGGCIELRVLVNDKKAFVSVKNTGQGICARDIEHIFERFYKGDKSRSLDRTGVGLGLHIVKTLIDLHGEEIWVNSVEGQYCEFVFTIVLGNNK